jgi:hypothetical protein
MTEYLDYPLKVDGRGRMATTGADDHVRDLIYQVLFTNPGERVNRPEFGGGLLQMVFMPLGDAVATATQMLVQGALQRWLGDVIRVEDVEVHSDGARLTVTVTYIRREIGRREQARFDAPITGM